MKKILTYLILLTNFSTKGQNLIHNPSFEQSTACPSDTGKLVFASEWFSAGADADLFDSCCNNCNVDIPYNFMGYQQPYSGGHAYAGIYFYQEYLPNSHGYLCGSTDPLTIGHWYRLKIHLCGTYNTRYSCYGPQAFLYINQTIPTSHLLPFAPQIDFGSFTTEDTTTWSVPNKIFYADSAYTKIIIGNFNDDAHSLVDTKASYATNPIHAAYAYIDGLSLIDITATYLAGLEQEQQKVVVAPNPFTDYTTLTFNNPQSQPYSLSIYNMQGMLIRIVNNVKDDKITLQRDGLPAAYYFYRLSNNDATIATGKLLIQ